MSSAEDLMLGAGWNKGEAFLRQHRRCPTERQFNLAIEYKKEAFNILQRNLAHRTI